MAKTMKRPASLALVIQSLRPFRIQSPPSLATAARVVSANASLPEPASDSGDQVLKRLASRHATREAALDDMLRRHRFVDLYVVVREQLRISEPGYSLKNVEKFFRAAREGKLAALLGLEGGYAIDEKLESVERYYRMGVRYMSPAWTYSLSWAGSSGDAEGRTRGLNDTPQKAPDRTRTSTPYR